MERNRKRRLSVAEIPLEESARRHYIGVRRNAVEAAIWDVIDPTEEARAEQDAELDAVLEEYIQDTDDAAYDIQHLMEKAFDLGFRTAGKLNDQVGL